MKLPLLSVDCRDKTIENNHVAGTIVVVEHDNTDTRVAYVYADADGFFNGAGEIVDRCNKYPALIKALRKLAVVGRQTPGIQGQVLYDGERCRICHAEWRDNQPEKHATSCVLENTKDG